MNTLIKDINEQLVLRCKNGDSEAYGLLYNATSHVVFNAIKRLMKNQEDAEDILQETYLSAFGAIETFQSNASVTTWIKRIGINKSLNALKKRKLEFVDSEVELKAEEDEVDYNQFEAIDVAKSIINLPDGYRVVMSLYLLEGYSHEEIANELEISVSTSKSQYHRGKKKLKEILLKSQTV